MEEKLVKVKMKVVTVEYLARKQFVTSLDNDDAIKKDYRDIVQNFCEDEVISAKAIRAENQEVEMPEK